MLRLFYLPLRSLKPLHYTRRFSSLPFKMSEITHPTITGMLFIDSSLFLQKKTPLAIVPRHTLPTLPLN